MKGGDHVRCCSDRAVLVVSCLYIVQLSPATDPRPLRLASFDQPHSASVGSLPPISGRFSRAALQGAVMAGLFAGLYEEEPSATLLDVVPSPHSDGEEPDGQELISMVWL